MMQFTGALRLICELRSVFSFAEADNQRTGRSVDHRPHQGRSPTAVNQRGKLPAFRMILGKMVELRDDRPVESSVQGFR